LANGKKEEDLLIDKSAATDREPEQTADDEAAPQSSSTDFGKLTQTG
jgi:hypothetical protein